MCSFNDIVNAITGEDRLTSNQQNALVYLKKMDFPIVIDFE